MGRAAEILFDPTLIGYTEERGVHHLILDAINKCDHYKRNRLYDAIYLVGGNCDINNFQQRLLNELKIKIANKKNKKNIKIRGQHLNKITTPFIGGTLIASNSQFQKLSISVGCEKPSVRNVEWEDEYCCNQC